MTPTPGPMTPQLGGDRARQTPETRGRDSATSQARLLGRGRRPLGRRGVDGSSGRRGVDGSSRAREPASGSFGAHVHGRWSHDRDGGGRRSFSPPWAHGCISQSFQLISSNSSSTVSHGSSVKMPSANSRFLASFVANSFQMQNEKQFISIIMNLDGCDRLLFSLHPFRALLVGNILWCLLVCVNFIFFVLFLFDIRAYP